MEHVKKYRNFRLRGRDVVQDANSVVISWQNDVDLPFFWQVSRTFLQAGAAAGTVARSISAYDMKMSDVNYGKASLGLELSSDA